MRKTGRENGLPRTPPPVGAATSKGFAGMQPLEFLFERKLAEGSGDAAC
jgi:hypothetical protein